MKSDAEIVQEIVAGKQSAYAELVERYEYSVRAVAAEILGDLHSAEDVAQEAFLTAYVKLKTLRKPSAFGAWIFRTARRMAIRASRKAHKWESLDESTAMSEESTDGRLDEEALELMNLVARLPRHERRVVLLKHFGDRNVSEIARMTNRPVGTVTKQLSRAHARLRGWMKGDGE